MVTYWVWQVDRVQVFTFLFHHKLNRLDGRTSGVVLVVSRIRLERVEGTADEGETGGVEQNQIQSSECSFMNTEVDTLEVRPSRRFSSRRPFVLRQRCFSVIHGRRARPATEATRE